MQGMVRVGGWAAAIVAGLVLATSAFAAEVTLRITLQLPMKSHLGQNLLLFQERVETLSGGEIAVEIYDAAQLYRDKDVPEAVGSGQIEMGVVSLTQYVGEIPAVDVFYMPFLFNTDEKVRAAVAPGSSVRGAIDEAIAATGSRVLWWQAYGTVVLLSNGGAIAVPNDMKGKKVRVFGKTLGTFVQAVGGVPTLISGSEQFLAYQRGTVDIGMTGVAGVEARSLWDVMDTITRLNVADIECVVVINEAIWNSLTEEQRGWIEEAARDAEIDVRDRMAEIEAGGYAAGEAHGMTVRDLSPEEVAAWKSASQPVIDRWLQSAGPLGRTVYDAANAL